MAPGPFCCYSAIPSSLRYLSHLLPKTSTHNPLTNNKGSAPLLTSFLVHLCTSAPAIPNTIPEGTSPLFYAIIQVKRIHPLGQTVLVKTPAPSSSKETLSSASSSTSIISAPTKPTQPSCITTSTTGPYPLTPSPSSKPKPKPKPHPTYASEHYFVPLEKSNEPTALDISSRVFSHGFRSISTQEAMESLRFPETGILIGDGEKWRELEGMEKLWCEGHKVWFELRVWVRKDVAKGRDG